MKDYEEFETIKKLAYSSLKGTLNGANWVGRNLLARPFAWTGKQVIEEYRRFQEKQNSIKTEREKTSYIEVQKQGTNFLGPLKTMVTIPGAAAVGGLTALVLSGDSETTKNIGDNLANIQMVGPFLQQAAYKAADLMANLNYQGDIAEGMGLLGNIVSDRMGNTMREAGDRLPIVGATIGAGYGMVKQMLKKRSKIRRTTQESFTKRDT